MARESTVLGYFGHSVTGATAVLITSLILAACVSGPTDSVLPVEPENQSDSDDGATTSEDSLASIIRPDDDGLSITVTRVSDGDSLRATSSEGDLEIRLLGVNAPERDECFGSEAGDELTALLDDGTVTLHPWPGERDEFGRQLGFLMVGDVFVNLSLVETGHVVSRNQSDHGFDREFEDAERAASEAGRGLWASDACGTPSDAELRIVEVFENAPGNDRENPNGEYVVINNEGNTAVDLEGWALRDESTRHRFTFPSITIPGGASMTVRTGCGTNEIGATELEVFWCDPEPPVWNNGGDTAFLLDPNGAIADNFVVRG